MHTPRSPGTIPVKTITVGRLLPVDVNLSCQHQSKGKMKATTIIAAVILTLNTGFLFAGNETSSAPATSANTVNVLAPKIPAEATFEEVITIDVTGLAPAIPAEAGFEEIASEPSAGGLSPVTPATADFDDEVIMSCDPALVPMPPVTADFE
jgi:hypothetical protein